MDEIIEIVVSLVGLILYWLLTTKKAKSKKKKPQRVSPPRQNKRESQRELEFQEPVKEEPEKVVEEEKYEEEEDFEDEPMTFKELLEQFTSDKPKRPVFKAPEEESKSETFRKQHKIDTEEEYRPLLKGSQQLMKPGEHTGSILKKSIEDFPTPTISTPALQIDDKKKVKGKSKIGKLLKDKNNLKNALIMKEVIDRKYF